MRIDNGRRERLVIEGVFDGMAGLSRGILAFIPNRSRRDPTDARGGTLDGQPVALDIERDGDGPAYLARYRYMT